VYIYPETGATQGLDSGACYYIAKRLFALPVWMPQAKKLGSALE